MIDGKIRWMSMAAPLMCCCILAVAAMSCSDEPTQQNSLVVPVSLTGMVVHDTTITAVNDSTFKLRIPTNGLANCVGSTQGYTASAVLVFYPSDFPVRDTAAVFSAKLTLRSVYRLGPPGGTLSFDVYSLSHAWDQTTLRWDSVQSGFYDASVRRGSFSGVISADTQDIVVDLDTAMVRLWLRNNTDAPNAKYGIIMVPASGSSVVSGFNSFESDTAAYYPTLQVIAGNTAGTILDTASYSSGIDTWVGDVTLPANPAVISLQAGVAYRAKIDFDVSFLPKGATVNSADLLLDFQPGASLLTGATTDTTVIAQLSLAADASSIGSGVYNVRHKSGTPTTFDGNMTQIVQDWVRGPNYGVVLRTDDTKERSSFDLYTFSGTRSPTASARPRLKIVYSVAKN